MRFEEYDFDMLVASAEKHLGTFYKHRYTSCEIEQYVYDVYKSFSHPKCKCVMLSLSWGCEVQEIEVRIALDTYWYPYCTKADPNLKKIRDVREHDFEKTLSSIEDLKEFEEFLIDAKRDFLGAFIKHYS